MFRTTAEKGSFGEYCYMLFAKENGFLIRKEGILECDFIVSDKYLIDVKTTESEKVKYVGTRISENISYDVISIKDGIVKIYPDLISPLKNFSGDVIGKTDVLLDRWRQSKKTGKVLRSQKSIHKENRNSIKSEILDLFKKSKNEKLRIVFRGLVSNTRWKSSPDNLPGSVSQIANNDITVFVQMKSENNAEKVSKIYIFKHIDLYKFPMKNTDQRQKNKGIEKVIDLEEFEKKFPELIFENMEGLRKQIEGN